MSGREGHGLPMKVVRGTAASPAQPHTALRLPVFRPLYPWKCGQWVSGIARHLLTALSPKQPYRCTSLAFRQCETFEIESIGVVLSYGIKYLNVFRKHCKFAVNSEYYMNRHSYIR
jgi:hypothetical protein